MIEIPIIVMDIVLGAILILSIIFFIDWTVSGKKLYGEYIDYRHIPPVIAVIWFLVSLIGSVLATLWFLIVREVLNTVLIPVLTSVLTSVRFV